MNVSTEKIIILRRERGWSQEKLAAIASVSERTIQRVEADGNCSLDTKMALASAFDISPVELGAEMELVTTPSVFKTSWAGALGLFILGLLAPIIILLTATNGVWEMVSMGVVWGMTIILAIMNYGFKSTYRLFDNTSWIVKYPTYVSGLNIYIVQAQSVIQHAYIVGAVASLVYALTVAVHLPSETNNTLSFISYSIRPLIYSILFSELWFRPFKKRMEAMLIEQSSEKHYSLSR